MKQLLLLKCFLLISLANYAATIPVKNLAELKKANAGARPGDIIILQNGEWRDVVIELNATGTQEQPITFKSAEAGKVIFTGHSQLKLGGNYIIVDGFYFTNGYAGDDAVIDFRIDKKQLANNCRVTKTVINDFNNPKRMDENYWVSFSGKNNRVDHCSFLNKKNMGVLMAVILDDERSRENFHSIDHNYFGVRLPLASNSGEIIRVGVSQHAEFNSNTQITDNYFEYCDGETEIVSIKSCSNVVRDNLFKESQGGVVLRHGDYNTVENNVFLGNGKDGTGGVRIINKGQWVVNNLFYKCRGTGFRSPLSVMNGVPNSPANRYVQVTDAVIAHNSFFNCTPISFGEGSDTERTATPNKVFFLNNTLYNNAKVVYNSYDDISGFRFAGNAINKEISQQLANGFIKSTFTTKNTGVVDILVPSLRPVINDSLSILSKKRLRYEFPNTSGFGTNNFARVYINAMKDCGAGWFNNLKPVVKKSTLRFNCKNTRELKTLLSKNYSQPLLINLTGDSYIIDSPISVTGNVTLTSGKKEIKMESLPSHALPFVFEIRGGSTLAFIDLYLELELLGLNTKTFITGDLNGSSGHSNFSMMGCEVKKITGMFFDAARSTIFDSIIIRNNSFQSNDGTLFNFSNETDKKGYYNVEQLKIINNHFSNNLGQLLSMLRGGNDESTMGPLLLFKNNRVENCRSGDPMILLNGTQRSFVENNRFTSTNTNGILIKYEDAVRAEHFIRNNTFVKSGKVVRNKFVNG